MSVANLQNRASAIARRATAENCHPPSSRLRTDKSARLPSTSFRASRRLSESCKRDYKDAQQNPKIYSYSVFYEAASEGGYVAFAPALPGCHTQGETLEETEKNIKEAIELYLESLIINKEAVPEEIKSFQSTVRVPISLPT